MKIPFFSMPSMKNLSLDLWLFTHIAYVSYWASFSLNTYCFLSFIFSYLSKDLRIVSHLECKFK